jgi:hypothetical protein
MELPFSSSSPLLSPHDGGTCLRHVGINAPSSGMVGNTPRKLSALADGPSSSPDAHQLMRTPPPWSVMIWMLPK